MRPQALRVLRRPLIERTREAATNPARMHVTALERALKGRVLARKDVPPSWLNSGPLPGRRSRGRPEDARELACT